MSGSVNWRDARFIFGARILPEVWGGEWIGRLRSSCMSANSLDERQRQIDQASWARGPLFLCETACAPLVTSSITCPPYSVFSDVPALAPAHLVVAAILRPYYADGSDGTPLP